MAGARIQLKRATSSSWSSSNPVLLAGEIGYETNTNKFKIGDGTTAYNSLPYFNGNLTGSSLNDLADVTIVSAANGDFLRWNGTAWVNDAVNLSTDTIGSYVESLVAGTGVTLTNNSGEAATPTIAIGQSVATTASVTFAHVSASVTGNVIGDLTGNADTASTLETARIIELSGDVTGSASFDGSSNINISVTSNPDSITLGTDTTGNYVVDLAGGTGVTITHTPGEGSTASVAIGQDVSTTASVTFDQLTVNGQTNVGGDIIPDTTEAYDLGSASARFRDIYLSGTTIDLGGATITSDGTDVSFSGGISVGGSANFVGDLTGNADTASTLETARTISLAGDLSGSVSFNGSTDVTITATVEPDSVALGTDTTGNYMVDVVGGTGVTVTHTASEGSSASVAIGQDVATTASVTFAHVSASVTGNVVGDLTGNADTASTLETSRTISLAGDLSGSVSFDGSTDVTITATVQPDSVALGTDTTGNYVNDVVAGTGVTVTHTPGEGSSASIAIGQSVGTTDNPSFAGLTADNVQIGITGANEIDTTSGNLTIDSAGGTVTVDDDLIVTGTLTVSGSATYVNTEILTVDDNVIVLNNNQTGAPSQNAGIEVERGDANNVQIRWNETADSWEITEDGTTYRNIAAGQDVETSSSVTFAAVTAPVIGNASTASALQTARAISLSGDLSGSVSFDGSTNVTLNATVEPNSVALGTDTTGNYLVDLSGQNGVSITHTPGEGSTASISLVQDINTSSSVTFAHVSADLTGDVTGNSDTASALQTARSISLAGDLSGSVSFDGSTDVTITATVQADSVALGTDTTGNYMTDVVAGTGVTVTHTLGEGSSASVAIGQDVATTASVTFAHVAADVTGDVTGNASTATTLETARAISLDGDLSGSVSFDGSQDVTITATVQPNSVALGTDTTGNYVADVVAGAAITVTHTPAEGSSASIALNASLNDLNDVVVSAPAEFQALAYDGIGWVPTYTPVVSYVRNAEATTLASGTVVYLFGGNGDHASVKRADNALETTSSKTVGVMGTAVASNQNGPVITRGYVDGINLSAYSVGDILWLGNNGGVTTTKPSAPLNTVFIGVVVRATANGIIYVAVQNGYELNELHDVKTNGKADKDVLMWNSASSIWINDQINLGTDTVGNYVNDVVAGTGVTVTHTPGEGSSASIAIGQDVSTSASVVFHTLETTHDLTIGGNFYVSGSIVTENQTSLEIDDPFIYLNGSSSVSNVDLGIAGNYNDGTYRHAGIFRDATDGKFKFFDSYEPEPSSPIDTGHASYSPAPVVAETFESTVTTGSAPFIVASTTEVTNLHADTASSLHTARAINLAGDLSGSVSFDGSGDVTLTATVEPNSVALGTDTTGNYMVNVAEGTGVTILHTPGEGSTASISIGQAVGTSSSVTFAAVTAPLIGNASTATTLQNARAISLAGDLSGSASFDGSSDVTITATVQPNSVALGTDTTGNYMSGVSAGTGITISHTPGEGSTATITNAGVTSVNGSTGAITGVVTTSDSGTVTSTMIANGTIVNADINTSAAIDKTKISGTAVTLSDTGTVTSTMIADGTIVNADINTSAAIAHSKLANATAGQVLLGTTTTGVITATTISGDITVTGGGVTAIGSGVIVDADVNAGAAIAHSKLANITAGSVLLGNASNVPTATALTGDVTINSSGVTAIASGVIVNADINTSAAIALTKLANDTTTALGMGTVELGHATDTTISRASAGRIAVEGVNVVTTSSTDTLSNKSIALGSNTVTGTKAQFDTAVTDDNFAYTGTANAFTASQTVTGTVTAQAASTQDAVVLQGRAGGTSSRSVTITPTSLTASRTLTLPDATTTVVGTDATQTLTNKTIAFDSNTVSGTLAQFNTAVTDADLVSLAGTETLTNKTLTSPSIGNATLTGTLTAGGSTGTANQFLRATGTGVEWAAATTSATTTTVSSSAATEVYSFSPTTYGAADLTVTVTQGSKKTALKSFVSHDMASTADAVNTSKIEYGSPAIPLTIEAEYVSDFSGTWTTQTSNFTSNYISSVVYGNDLWVAVGYGNNIRTSTDAVTWVTQTGNFVGNGYPAIRDVAYGNGTWVAVGYGGDIRTSTDAVTWNTQTSATTNLLTVAYGNSLWVVAGYGGLLQTSTDTVSWTTRASTFTTRIMGVAYGNGIWTAVGYDGIRTSTDAITWVTRVSSASVWNPIYFDAAYNDSGWVVSGANGHVRTSPDAITWTTQYVASSDFYTIAQTDGAWLIGGAGGYLYSSTDAVTWVSQAGGFSSYIRAVGYGNGKFVATDTSFATIKTSDFNQTVYINATITDANVTSATVKVLPTLVEA